MYTRVIIQMDDWLRLGVMMLHASVFLFLNLNRETITKSSITLILSPFCIAIVLLSHQSILKCIWLESLLNAVGKHNFILNSILFWSSPSLQYLKSNLYLPRTQSHIASIPVSKRIAFKWCCTESSKAQTSLDL